MSETRNHRLSRFLVVIGRVYCLGDPNIRARLRSFHCRQMLRRFHPPRILDAGCGRSGQLGWFGGIAPIAYSLSRQFLEAEVVGLDRDHEIGRHNQECASRGRIQNLEFFTRSIEGGESLGRFDVVVFSDIARDSDRDGQLLQNMSGLVAPGGVLLVICPSTERLVWHRWPKWVSSGTGFDAESISRVLAGSGLKVRNIRRILGLSGALAAQASDRISKLAYPLLVLLFPFLMTCGVLEACGSISRGETLLVAATRAADER